MLNVWLCEGSSLVAKVCEATEPEILTAVPPVVPEAVLSLAKAVVKSLATSSTYCTTNNS